MSMSIRRTDLEARHPFEVSQAVGGVLRALRYTPPALRAALREQALVGFDDFARDHAEFFARVNTP